MEELKPKKLNTKRSRPLSQGLSRHQERSMRPKNMPPIFHQGEAFRAKIEAKHSSFTKVLSKSHVSGPFWMHLPVQFCKKHLPRNDTSLIVENQNGKEYMVRYLAEKTSLSGGWRGFSIAEGFLEGDALVFHLVSPTKFKVYRIRKSDSVDADAIQKMDIRATSCHPGELVMTFLCRLRDSRLLVFPNHHILDASVGNVDPKEEKQQASSLSKETRDQDQEMLLSEYARKVLQKKGKSGASNSKSSITNPINLDQQARDGNFSDITSFQDFIILLDDLLKKEYQLPKHIKWSYYQLCCGQNVLLHANLPKVSNPILIAGVLVQTVDIANLIRNIELPIEEEEFAIVDENLHKLEVIGMNVGFMRAHVHHLRDIACDPKIAMYRQKLKDLCLQQDETDKEIKNFRAKLFELAQVYDERVADIEKMKSLIENNDLVFQEQRRKRPINWVPI